jgi:cell division protein FtsI (penicillin-binding protein 3)
VRVPLTLRKREQQPAGERVLDAGVARQVVTMLQSVVSREGTARRARVAGYDVAGKTGTVHKVTDSGYADDRYVALFAGMAPAEDPRYVTVVMVDDPRGEDYYGGLVAAPAFSRIMEGVLRTLEVTPRRPADTWAGGEQREGQT